jgi:hypothetical protein
VCTQRLPPHADLQTDISIATRDAHRQLEAGATSGETRKLNRSFPRAHAMSIHPNLLTISVTLLHGWQLGTKLHFDGVYGLRDEKAWSNISLHVSKMNFADSKAWKSPNFSTKIPHGVRRSVLNWMIGPIGGCHRIGNSVASVPPRAHQPDLRSSVTLVTHNHRMEDYEQPIAVRAAIARTSQACQRCRSLKTRCLPGSRAGVCQRRGPFVSPPCIRIYTNTQH